MTPQVQVALTYLYFFTVTGSVVIVSRPYVFMGAVYRDLWGGVD